MRKTIIVLFFVTCIFTGLFKFSEYINCSNVYGAVTKNQVIEQMQQNKQQQQTIYKNNKNTEQNKLDNQKANVKIANVAISKKDIINIFIKVILTIIAYKIIKLLFKNIKKVYLWIKDTIKLYKSIPVQQKQKQPKIITSDGKDVKDNADKKENTQNAQDTTDKVVQEENILDKTTDELLSSVLKKCQF